MTTTTLQPADIDTYINANAATTNYGTETTYWVGENIGESNLRRGLIKFNGLSDGTIGQTVSAATLSLYLINDNSNNNRTMRVYRQLRAWVETQATWNIYSTDNSWATAGGFGAADCEQTDIGSRAMSSTEAVGWKDYTLTAAKIQEYSTGVLANNGFLMKEDTESDDLYGFASRENATTANRPKMSIDHILASNKTTWFFSAIRQWWWERYGEIGLALLRQRGFPVHFTLDRRTGLWVNPITEARYMKPDAIMYRTILRAGG